MANDQIKKIYSLQNIGGGEVLKELGAINKMFIEIKKNKSILMALKNSSIEDPAKVSALDKQLSELLVREKALEITYREKQIQLKNLQLLRQGELAQQRAIANGNKAVEGSYNDINARLKALMAFVKNEFSLTEGTDIDEARREILSLQTVVDDFRRGFTKDGTLVGEYTSGIVEAFRRMGLDDVIQAQVKQAKEKLAELDQSFDVLKTDLRQLQNEGKEAFNSLEGQMAQSREEAQRLSQQSFEALKTDLNQIQAKGKEAFTSLEAQMIQNRQEAQRLSQQINTVESTLNQAGDVGATITEGLRKGFSNVRKEAVSFFISYLSFQQLLAAGQADIRLNKVLSDQLTDLQRILGATDEAIQSIEDSIKGIDTRTGLEDRFQFAILAARAGTAKENIVGVTKAIDELVTVAGKELGNVDETVESLIKLVNVFEGPGKVSEQNIRRYGNALVELANKGVASGRFLVDFAERLAGIEGISKIAITSVLGLGAAFEEQGQSAEVSASAVTQLILKMGQDVPKFAALAQMSEESFRTMLRNNPAEALLTLAQSVKGNSTAIDEISAKFPELEARGVRVASIFGVMADKSDFFREKIRLANAAINNSAAITDGAAKKQQNFAARFGDLSVVLQKIGSNRVVQASLTALVIALTALAASIGPLVIGLGLYGAAWLLVNRELVRAAIVSRGAAVATLFSKAATEVATLFNRAYAASLTLLTGALERSAAATTLFGLAMIGLGMGAVIVLIAGLVAGYKALTASVNGNIKSLRAEVLEMTALNEVRTEAKKRIVEEVTALNALVAVARNVKISNDTRLASMNKLIEKYPAMSAALNGERIDLEQLAKAYKEVTRQILLKAEAQASSDLASEKQKSVLEVIALRQQLETESVLQGGKNGKGSVQVPLSPALTSLLTAGLNADNSSLRNTGKGVVFLANDLPKIVAYLKQVENTRTQAYNAYMKVSADKSAELTQFQVQQDQQIQSALEGKANSGGATIAQLQLLLDKINEDIKGMQEFDPKLTAARAKRDELQKRIDAALGKSSGGTGRGSRLSGETQDKFKDVEAATNAKLTLLETAYQAEDATQKTYNGVLIDNERDYLTQKLAITEEGIQNKLKLLDASNAAERQKASELHLQLLTEQRQTNDRLYQIDLDALQADFDREENAAQERLNQVVTNSQATEVEKANAQANFAARMVELQIAFNETADALEKRYNKASEKNAEDRNKKLLELRRKLNTDLNAATETGLNNELNEIQRRLNDKLAEINKELYEKANAIAQDAALSNAQKQEAIRKLELSGQSKVIAALNQSYDEEMAQYQYMLDNKLITQEAYNAKVDELNKQKFNNLKKSLDAEEEAERRREAYRLKAVDLAFDAANAFAAQQRENADREIDQNYETKQSYLDKEKEIALSKALSKEEELAIEKEFDQKRRVLEKERGEEKKKNAKAQLAIEFAIAAIKAYSTSLTMADGIAAAALIGAEYAIKYALIEAQQFEGGGNITRDGGVFGGRRHSRGGTPFRYGGSVYEAEAGELSIINRRSATSNQKLSISGTPRQIASAVNSYGGGVDFAPGAVFGYRGGLGSTLTAPTFIPGNTGDYGDLVRDMYHTVMALVGSLQQMEVILDTGNLSRAYKEAAQNKAISRI